MTIPQILIELAPYRAMSHTTLYKHLHSLRIKPLGKVRQSPQVYPPDTAKRVLVHLGIKPATKITKRNRRQLAA
jgi:hypothetical protein